MLGSRWRGAPRRTRVIVAACVVVFVYGTVVHLVQLIRSDLNPYPTVPSALGFYFVALTVLDPLAAGLLARGLRTGVVLAVAVLVTDAVANAYADYVLAGSGATARTGQAVITGLAVILLVDIPSLWRFSAPDRVPAQNQA